MCINKAKSRHLLVIYFCFPRHFVIMIFQTCYEGSPMVSAINDPSHTVADADSFILLECVWTRWYSMDKLSPALSHLLYDPEDTTYFTDIIFLTKVRKSQMSFSSWDVYIYFSLQLVDHINKSGGVEISCLCIRISWSGLQRKSL